MRAEKALIGASTKMLKARISDCSSRGRLRRLAVAAISVSAEVQSCLSLESVCEKRWKGIEAELTRVEPIHTGSVVKLKVRAREGADVVEAQHTRPRIVMSELGDLAFKM